MTRQGQFSRQVFPLLPAFEAVDPFPLFEAIDGVADRFKEFRSKAGSSTGFRLPNGYFDSPDAEILYAMVHRYRPRRIVEVGSGHSTFLSRAAIEDGHLNTQLISIDPHPRRELASLPDQFIPQAVEHCEPEIFLQLAANDILFIDSSHEIKTGNDGVFLYLQILPLLRPGVLIHIHDIFLPYDYPQDWVVKERWGWNEQYLIQAILASGDRYEVIWPGYYLQQHHAAFAGFFPDLGAQSAKSLWLRTKGS